MLQAKVGMAMQYVSFVAVDMFSTACALNHGRNPTTTDNHA